MARKGDSMKGETYLWYNEDDAKQAVKLLRRQHAGFVGMVKHVKKTGKHPVSKIHETPQWMEGYFQACDDILTALETRKKGKSQE